MTIILDRSMQSKRCLSGRTMSIDTTLFLLSTRPKRKWGITSIINRRDKREKIEASNSIAFFPLLPLVGRMKSWGRRWGGNKLFEEVLESVEVRSNDDDVVPNDPILDESSVRLRVSTSAWVDRTSPKKSVCECVCV